MFNRKEKQKSNTGNSDKYDLLIDNEKLKLEKETLEFKLEQMNEKYAILEKELREFRYSDIKKLKTENDSLKQAIEKWQFKEANGTSNIELVTENKMLKSELEVQKLENKHIKELLETYRAMPDIKNIVDSLASLAVPHIDELKEFSKIISDSKIIQLCEELSETNSSMKAIAETLKYGSMRGYR